MTFFNPIKSQQKLSILSTMVVSRCWLQNMMNAGLLVLVLVLHLLLANDILLVGAVKESNVKPSKQSENSVVDGPFSAIHEKYRQLSPKGRAIAGATMGFVGSRLALRTVTTIVKFGAGAYIATEVVKLTGIMDDLALSEEQSNLLKNVKTRVLRTAEDYRQEIRRQFNRNNFETFLEKERMFAFGLAGGAVAGALL